MLRIRVVRVLVYEGDPDWIENTLDRNAVTRKQGPRMFGNNSIEELAMSWEEWSEHGSEEDQK